jgi:hypothetical protein
VSASTLTVVPGTTTAPGTAATAEPSPLGIRPALGAPAVEHAFWRGATEPDYFAWLNHVMPAAACANPIRLVGQIVTLNSSTGQLLSMMDTADLPDGAIYKPCGNRRATTCPGCAQTYQRDAYQLLRAGLVGGKGVPDTVAGHPAVFVTLTAPGFGAVHTRTVTKHTCTNRKRCDCRPQPCHARRDAPTCEHGQPAYCFARHELGDPRLGQPLCVECYDHPHHVVWNHQAGELWRRTRIAIERHIRRTARTRGIPPKTVRLSYGKVAEMQRRGVVHYHAVIRLDGADPFDPTLVLPPPAELVVGDLVDAVEHAARITAYTTDPHPTRSAGWPVRWGEQLDIRIINLGADDAITDSAVAGYLAKYATKSTEATGHLSRRLTDETISVHADPDGSHVERLVDACWMLGRPRDWRGLRRWAHMLGFGGHFLTKSRRYSVTFRILRDQRIIYRRTQPPPGDDPRPPEDDTTLVINFLNYAGAGWHTTGDALLANSAADRARERQRIGREELAALVSTEG